MSYIIGIDTGGTFTDVAVIDEKGTITTAKSLTTYPDFERGVLNVLLVAAEKMGTTLPYLLAKTNRFGYGTTVATNALWTRSGARVGFITTRGFEDTIHIGRGLSKWAGLPEAAIKHMSLISKPRPVVDKELIVGITERIDYKGRILCPLNKQEVKEAVKTLVDKGAEAITIGFLWSNRNPLHEQQAQNIALEMYPDLYVSTSSSISSTIGEYERFTTAAIDAYVAPATAKFLQRLAKKLNDNGFRHEILILKADGGVAPMSAVLPVATIHSGPAGGVIATKVLGELFGYSNIMSADVGGTSFDVSLICQGAVSYTREPTLEKFSVSYPSLDIKSIGAGGGSLIRIDPILKTITVGPQSAGSLPGPACYGFGGLEPTITDALVVLGYLNPDNFLGGRMKIYAERAHEALRKAGEQMRMSAAEVAAGAYDILNAHTTDLIRVSSVERGHDPRRFVLFAFGGLAAAHAPVWKHELGIEKVVVTPYASVYSALGIAISDTLYTHTLFDYAAMPVDVNSFNTNFTTVEKKVTADLDEAAIEEKDREISYFLDMMYGGQIAVFRVPIPKKKYMADDMDAISHEFDRLYEGVFGKGSAFVNAGRRVVNYIVQGLGRAPKVNLVKIEEKGTASPSGLKGKRNVFFRTFNDYVETNIYDYDNLYYGNIINGPAIVEMSDTVIVIPPGDKGIMDEYRNIVL